MSGMNQPVFPGRLGLQQRVFPAYRAPFYDALAEASQGGLSVFAGQPLPEENIAADGSLKKARFVLAQNRNFFPISSPLYQCWQSGFLRWLEEWQPLALIVEGNSRYPSTRLAVRWMHNHHRPVIGWGLGAPPLKPKGVIEQLLVPWRRWERISLLKSLDGVIAYSRRGAEEYRALGLKAGQIFVAPNAVTPRPDSPLLPRSETVDECPTLLYVGRLQPRKRIDLLLQACAALTAERQPNLWIIGDGPARSGFESLAREIYPKAEFFGDQRGPSLERYYKKADLFVLPGTGGLAVQQAMAHGLPVIVAQGDGTQEDLVRPENGLLVPPNDPAALIEAIRSALSDIPRLRRMGEESYRIVVEEINLERMVEAFVEALNQIILDCGTSN